jgi:serine phosphatase RsbU (regulator of sigma subunit)
MIQITNYVPTNTETDKKGKKATSIVNKKSKKGKKKNKNIKTERLNYYNAGHEEPVLLDKEITRLPASEQEMQMEKGMMIFLFNRGLMNVENKANKQYGENRMLGAALQAMKTDARPEPFVASITDNINTFIGDTEPQADIAMLAIKC